MKYPLRPHLPGVMTVPGDGSFTQGFVAAACVSAFQDIAPPSSRAKLKRVLRHGLQGGMALAAGSRTALALRHRDYSGALIAAASGAVGVLLIENLLRDSAPLKKEEHHG